MAQVYEPASRPYKSAGEMGRGVLFCGIVILILGIMNVVYGIAAIDKSAFFITDAKFVIAELNSWVGSCSWSA